MSEKNLKTLDHAILDAIELLVESELPDSERKKLFVQLDLQPELWRVLAIAFVEQQSVLRSVRSGMPPVKLNRQSTQHRMPQALPRTWVRWRQFAMTAAGLLLMFALGYAMAASHGNKEFAAPEVFPKQKGKDVSTNEESKATESTNNEETPAKSFPVAPNVAGYVQWREGARTKLLPLFRGEKVDASWLESHPLEIDKKTTESLTQSGWVANPSRRIVSIKLLGGESYTVPVDDVQYRYVGRSVY